MMTYLIARFGKDESGATAIEYGLIAGLISVVIIGVVAVVGEDLTAVFSGISKELENPTTP